MKSKNKFSILLQNLMLEVGLKNSALARDLQYDVSYISKWSSGRFLPSDKNIDTVANSIAACIVNSLQEEKQSEMLEKYHAVNLEELKDNIYRALLRAYSESKNKEYEGQRFEVEKAYISGVPVRKITKDIKFSEMNGQEKTEIVAVLDVFSMDHESRLLLAGIEKGRFAIRDNFPNVHFSMILNAFPVPMHEELDYVYDSIFLIHMLTSFSRIDFQLYNQFFAYGKCIYVERDKFSVSGILLEDENQCIATMKSRDELAVNELYQKIKMMCSQETLVFRKSSIYAMIQDYEYMQSVLSPEVRLLLGHMTELMVPVTLFDELMDNLPAEWKDIENELKRIHILTSSIIQKSDVHIMIYESAFANFIVSGELDFYNNCLYLTPEQRMICLEYVSDILQKRGFAGVKMINGGFSTDFQYITNPCLFMSSCICYLRLENGCYNNNILILNDKTIKDMFLRFWQEIWNRRSDVVIEGENALDSKMEHYIQSVHLLKKME